MSTTRIQLALNVRTSPRRPRSTRRLFGTGPHKVREGYANFAVERPAAEAGVDREPGRCGRAPQPSGGRGGHRRSR